MCTCVCVCQREEVDNTEFRQQSVVKSQQYVYDCVFVCVCVVGITTWGFLTFCLQLQMVPDTGALCPLHYDPWERGDGAELMV